MADDIRNKRMAATDVPDSSRTKQKTVGWTRPWKREELDEVGKWLCPSCESSLDPKRCQRRAAGSLLDEYSRRGLMFPLRRVADKPIQVRKCTGCDLPGFCKLFRHEWENKNDGNDENGAWLSECDSDDWSSDSDYVVQLIPFQRLS